MYNMFRGAVWVRLFPLLFRYIACNMSKTEISHYFEYNLCSAQLSVGALSLCLFAKLIYGTLCCQSVIAAPALETVCNTFTSC